LPVAVGEMSRMFWPVRIFGMPFFWGSVGVVNPFCSNSLRMGLTSVSKVFGGGVCTLRWTSVY